MSISHQQSPRPSESWVRLNSTPEMVEQVLAKQRKIEKGLTIGDLAPSIKFSHDEQHCASFDFIITTDDDLERNNGQLLDHVMGVIENQIQSNTVIIHLEALTNILTDQHSVLTGDRPSTRFKSFIDALQRLRVKHVICVGVNSTVYQIVDAIRSFGHPGYTTICCTDGEVNDNQLLGNVSRLLTCDPETRVYVIDKLDDHIDTHHDHYDECSMAVMDHELCIAALHVKDDPATHTPSWITVDFHSTNINNLISWLSNQ